LLQVRVYIRLEAPAFADARLAQQDEARCCLQSIESGEVRIQEFSMLSIRVRQKTTIAE
jgi:hypothetical protein